jgi:glycosyl transferase family 25
MDASKIGAFYINLDERTDRRIETELQLSIFKAFGISVLRVPAVKNAVYGAIGCVASHINVLLGMVFNTDYDYAIVFEDDFSFRTQGSELSQNIENLLNINLDFDIIALAYNQPLLANGPTPQLKRLLGCFTTSGYIVKRSFAYDLVKVFLESHETLCRNIDLKPHHLVGSIAALDVMWKPLLAKSKSFAHFPALGYQRPSYSNVENKFADYNV